MNLSWLFRRTITLSAPVYTPAGASRTRPGPLTLADISALNVPLSWPEAVGIILEVLERTPAGATPPAPTEIALLPCGELRRLSAIAMPGPPVRTAALMLSQLIGGSAAPPALRDLIEENAGERPAHSALGEFARSLGYFEQRADRRADIAAVCARSQALVEKAAADIVLERLRTKATCEQPEGASFRGLRQRLRSDQVLNGVYVAGLYAIIIASAIALLSVAVGPEPQPTPTRTGGLQSPPAGAALAASHLPKAEAPMERAGVGVAPRVDREGPAIRTATIGTDARVPLAPPTPARSARNVPSYTAAATVRTPTPRAVSTAQSTSRGQWTVTVQEITARSGLAEFVTLAADVPGEREERRRPIYSRTDPEVVPAVLKRPQLPSVPEDSLAQEVSSELDLLIDVAGHVEQVRLVSPGNRFNDRILMAAAKAWQFQPASRDGQPVRYRLRLRLTP